MGLVRPEQAAAAPEGSLPAELSSRVIAKGFAVLPDRECFSGLAAKSRELSCLSGLLKRGGSSPGAPADTTVALSVPAPAAATAAQLPKAQQGVPGRRYQPWWPGDCIPGRRCLYRGWHLCPGGGQVAGQGHASSILL